MLGIGIGIPFNKVTGSGGVAPSNSVAPVASVPYAIAGQTLSCTTGTWSGTPTITYSYQWQSSADGSTGWANVGGATSSTYVIPSSAAQLLFYRCVVTGTNAFGAASANSNVIGGVDSQANTHFNRVTADSGVMTYGLVGVDTYTKTLKFIYNVSDITTKFAYVRHLDYLGYKVGTGSGTTLGRACQTVYSLTGVNYDLRQTTVTSQPFLGAFDGTNKYLLAQGGTNVGFQTPNNVNNQLINDFAIECRCNLLSTGTQGITGKVPSPTGGTFAFYKSSNTLVLVIFQSGTAYTYTSTTTTSRQYLRVSRNATSGIIQFFDSLDGVTWSQVGTNVAGITGTLTNANAPVWVGFTPFYAGSTGEHYYINFYKDSTFTTPTQKFEPNNYNRQVSQSTFTASTGEVWTFTTGSAATGLKPMIIDQTMIQGNGTSMGMSAASATINTQVFTQYNVWRKYSSVVTAGANGILNEFGSSVSAGAGLAFNPNDPANTESLYTSANGGLNGTSWASTSIDLKLSTFRGDVNGSPYEQTLATNNVANTFNAVQASGANTTAIIATGDNLLARNNAASLWINAAWVAGHLTTATDSSTEATNVYNYVADLTNII